MSEWKTKLIEASSRPGIELIHFRGPAGYQDEQIILSNGLVNGLRIEVLSGDRNWRCFHIHDAETARALAERLIEWSGRIADPHGKSGAE